MNQDERKAVMSGDEVPALRSVSHILVHTCGPWTIRFALGGWGASQPATALKGDNWESS